jgi:hypothetical protein
MGDNVRRFLGLPIKNPDPDAVKPPVMQTAGAYQLFLRLGPTETGFPAI